MAFVPFPILFTSETDADIELKDELKIPLKTEESFIYLNTNLISSYCRMDNGNTAVWMAGGESYTLLIKFENFLNKLNEVDYIHDLASEN